MTHLAHALHQRPVGHDDVPPHGFDQLVLRYQAASVLNEVAQDLEALWTPANDTLETALRGWAYRIRTSICREKIHLFDTSSELGFRRHGVTVAVPGEDNLLC
jgi:hypothetical protein